MIQDTTSIDAFLDYLDPFLVPQSIQQQLPPSDVVGNIRFSHPTLYVFPGGQGDSALFGINGFNLLVDGGFSRKACFWDFSRHLDRLDAILITRISDDNAGGMSALLQRKTMSAVYPQIGHVFANLPQTEKCNEKSEEEQEEDEDSLLINVIEEGNAMLQNLQILNLQPQVCLRDRDNAFKPINLYHKVGHGKLDMYVINPSKDAKEIREFMERWNGENSKTLGTFKSGINVDGKELWLPLANLVSICALLVWFPDNPDDTITRLLFPGSTPQNKVLRGLDKLKELEFMQKPVCASRSMRQTVQPVADKKDAMKQAMKMTARPTRESQSVKAEKTDLSAKKSSVSSLRSERKPTESKVSKKFEDKTPRSPKRKPEDKAQKERRNQAAGQQIKEKASVLKREKPLTSVRSSAKSAAAPEKAVSSRKPVSKAGLPPSKTKKEASNKTKKEEVTKSLKSRKKSAATNGVAEQPTAAPVADQNKEDQNGDMNGHVSPTKSVMAGLAAVVSTATCAAAMVMTEPIQQLEEEVESIVEKHQIEEMERTSNAPKETEDDDIEPELQRIKDDEDVHEQEAREPDIPVAALPIEEKLPEVPAVAKPVAATTHVKTPDEVEDLPEHEAVEPEIATSQDPEAEELSPAEEKKIALDLQEKETVEEKEIAEEVQNIVLEQVDAQPEVVQEQTEPAEESEGAQEQRELSEVIVSAQQESMPAVKEEFKEHIEKLQSVLNNIIAIYEEEMKSSKSINNESLQNDIGDHLEKCIKLLNSLTYDSPPSTEELFNTKRACNSTVELVRKCMKLAIELIEAESEGATSFMEHLHSEPDLILHCQEIEDFCDSKLPKDAVEAMSAEEKHSKEENDGEDKETNEAVENEPGRYLKTFAL